MLRLVIKKLIQGLLMVLVVAALTFWLLSRAGGDSLSALRDNPQISAETIENLRRVYGLDRPFVERYGNWLGNAMTGDLGESFSFKVPVGMLVWSRFIKTAMLACLALAVAISLSLILAILVTRYPRSLLSTFVEIIILATASTPRMVLALLALFLSLHFGLAYPGSAVVTPFQILSIAFVLALPLISAYLAQLRNGLDEAMSEDFVLLARAKGLTEWQIVLRHALRPALNPFLTVAGLSLGGLLGGSVIVEIVLGWPGLGALMVGAVRARDVPLVMGVVIISTIAVWFGNTVAEILQFVNDKRLRPGVME